MHLYFFENVTVYPTLKLRQSPTFFLGGPLLPEEIEIPPEARFCRNGRPRDKMLTPEDVASFEPPLERKGTYFWGGPVDHHIGHIIADWCTRLPGYLGLRGTVLFAASPRTTERDIQLYKQIAKWYGFAEDQILFLKRPITVERLYIAEQGEQMGGVGPSDDFLRRLEAITKVNEIDRSKAPEKVFISREFITQGKIAGENQLQSYLKDSGWHIFHPEKYSIHDQLVTYHNASHIFGIEGSAFHLLQLLGRQRDKTVFVMQRRPGMRIAEDSLRKRFPQTTYLESEKLRLFAGRRKDGALVESAGTAVLPYSALCDLLQSAGIEVDGFEKERFETAVLEDLRGLLERERTARFRSSESFQQLNEDLSNSGYCI